LTLKELEIRLVASKIPKLAYCLTGGLPNEAYTIENAGDKWLVYYSERGQRRGLKEFQSEEAASDYFFDMIARNVSPEN
jgi:hypothetical protein